MGAFILLIIAIFFGIMTFGIGKDVIRLKRDGDDLWIAGLGIILVMVLAVLVGLTSILPMPDTWYDHARVAIHEADVAMPPNVTPAERRQRIKAAYPFGERANYPYKAWLRAQREYLAKHDALEPKGTTPMEDFISARHEATHD